MKSSRRKGRIRGRIPRSEDDSLRFHSNRVCQLTFDSLDPPSPPPPVPVHLIAASQSQKSCSSKGETVERRRWRMEAESGYNGDSYPRVEWRMSSQTGSARLCGKFPCHLLPPFRYVFRQYGSQQQPSHATVSQINLHHHRVQDKLCFSGRRCLSLEGRTRPGACLKERNAGCLCDDDSIRPLLSSSSSSSWLAQIFQPPDRQHEHEQTEQTNATGPSPPPTPFPREA
ncbi:preprotein translocase subunit SecD [Anopheles sinensis]|uniref:Preprotein translocase subunit SecD n=1 Tax=Anopheles sinensis TaxID=74873 RepID=A0A084VYJ0_ANOSI|nr:preprotein translocase subunit SecD [Anopheles sinensis]